MREKKHAEWERDDDHTSHDRERSGIIRAAAVAAPEDDALLPTADGWDPVRPREQKAG